MEKSCGHAGEKVLARFQIVWDDGEQEESLLLCFGCMLVVGNAFDVARQNARQQRTAPTTTLVASVRPKGSEHLPVVPVALYRKRA